MSQAIIIKLNLSKIPREAIFQGEKGKYLDLIVSENRDGDDQYGNSHSVSVSQTKEQRERQEKRVYVGNGKWMGQRTGGQQRQQQERPSGGYRKANVPPPATGGATDDWDEAPPF